MILLLSYDSDIYLIFLLITFTFMDDISEYRESRIQHEKEDYPVLLVEDVNHGQVASGKLVFSLVGNYLKYDIKLNVK